jgi:hypothetical protein
MLKDAIYYRLAFDRLTSYERKRYEHISPSAEEWKNAETLLPFLRKFYDLTAILSGISMNGALVQTPPLVKWPML